MAGCDQISKLDPRRIDALEAQISTQQQAVGALRSDLLQTRSELMQAQNRLQALEAGPITEARSPQSSLNAEQTVVLNKTVAECVELVRASGAKPESTFDTVNAKFWSGFDAYYNPSTGRVENNVMYVGQRPVLYAFNKCMVSKGVPLS